MIPVKILSIRYLPGAEKGLAKALGAPEGYPCIAMLTTDCPSPYREYGHGPWDPDRQQVHPE